LTFRAGGPSIEVGSADPMAANLSPEYKDAEAAYRKAREPDERLRWLKEMLRAIPKHKGTEHLQADIKTRIKQLSSDLDKPKKTTRGGPTMAVRAEGAAQVALLGPPNSGKSSLHAKLTGSSAAVGPYPFTTHEPLPGMLPFEDVQFQLIDLPPLSASFMEPWMPNALVHADAALLIVDLGDPAVLEDIAAIRERLEDKRYLLQADADEGHDAEDDERDHIDDRRRVPSVLVATKSDLSEGEPEAELAAFRELGELPFVALSVSAETGSGLSRIGETLFELLQVVRVYTKLPGHEPEKKRPYALRRGATVQDVARLVHRGLAEEVKSARIWGTATFVGQQVSRDHHVADGDVIELHW
jgi:ribosome-interacting GTPase 1